MSDKGCDWYKISVGSLPVTSSARLTFTTGTAVRDGMLDTPREVGHTVLEEMVCNLHDSRHVLDDSHLWAFRHLRHGIGETVLRHPRVRVDEQDEGSDPDVTRGPSLSLSLLQDLLKGLVVHRVLVVFAPEMVGRTGRLVERSELVHDLFHTEGQRVGEVHITGFLESTLPDEIIDVVARSSDVGDVVIEIEPPPFIRILLGEELQTVIAHDDPDTPALTLVGRDCLLEGLDSGPDNLV